MTRSYLGYVSSQTTDFIPLMTYGVATGGTSSSITVSGTNYTLLTFTSSGTLTVSKEGLFDVLIFAGGGGVGTSRAEQGAGGGGGGGYLLATAYFSANQSIVIGAGGANTNYVQGSDSYITESRLFAQGGAPGANTQLATIDTTPTYGNGGGGQGGNSAKQLNANPLGFNGGIGSNSRNDLTWNGGGGGGATAAGVAGAFNSGGNGGAGYDVSSFIGGSTLSKGGGGGGGAKNAGTGGAGGANGASTSGGAGGANGAGSSAGANSAGGGGGGCAQSSTQAGGSGGSGIVYVRFKV